MGRRYGLDVIADNYTCASTVTSVQDAAGVIPTEDGYPLGVRVPALVRIRGFCKCRCSLTEAGTSPS